MDNTTNKESKSTIKEQDLREKSLLELIKILIEKVELGNAETKGNKQCKRHSGNTTPARPLKVGILSKFVRNKQRRDNANN